MRRLVSFSDDLSALCQHGGGPLPVGVIDFSVNLNPLGPPAWLPRSLTDHAHRLAAYPDAANRELIAALEHTHGLDGDHFLAGNGSNELIYLLAQAVRPKRVAIAGPTYSEYLRASVA